MPGLWGVLSYRGGRAILDPGRVGRAKIKNASMKRSCGVQDLSNEPLPFTLPALPGEQLRKLPSLSHDYLVTQNGRGPVEILVREG